MRPSTAERCAIARALEAQVRARGRGIAADGPGALGGCGASTV